MIQPPTPIKGFKMETDSNEFLQILEEKLKNMSLRTVSREEDASRDEETASEASEGFGEVNQLANMFASLNTNNEINPIYAEKPFEKYYYKRPSPHDLLFEEPEPFQNSYSGKATYEWNIDGLNDKQIVDVIHRIIMYSTVCKQHGNSDSAIASFISTGFVGQLRGWWDHYLNNEQKLEIMNHKKMVKIEPSSSTNLAVTTTGEEDVVYTLCLSILQHFVGTTVPIGEKLNTLLQNLRCPSLTHFRSYKDTFLFRVFSLEV